MSDPTKLLQSYTTTADETEQRAEMELDEDNSSLIPGEYIYWLAHIPPGSNLQQPFYSSDGGILQMINKVTYERTETGLVLDNDNLSINLKYYPADTPTVVFFGEEIDLSTSKLDSGIIAPEDSYDGKQVYKLNVYYDVEFYVIRHRPNLPELISQDDGGQLWEDYKGSGDLNNFPVEVRAWWE